MNEIDVGADDKVRGSVVMLEETCYYCGEKFFVPTRFSGDYAYKCSVKGKLRWFCKWSHLNAVKYKGEKPIKKEAKQDGKERVSE